VTDGGDLGLRDVVVAMIVGVPPGGDGPSPGPEVLRRDVLQTARGPEVGVDVVRGDRVDVTVVVPVAEQPLARKLGAILSRIKVGSMTHTLAYRQ